MFTITQSKGFRIEFPNGYFLSVQWGPGNYCDHNSMAIANVEDWDKPTRETSWESKTAEVAIMHKDGFYRREGEYDDVKGYLSPTEVLEWMNFAANLPAKEVD